MFPDGQQTSWCRFSVFLSSFYVCILEEVSRQGLYLHPSFFRVMPPSFVCVCSAVNSESFSMFSYCLSIYIQIKSLFTSRNAKCKNDSFLASSFCAISKKGKLKHKILNLKIVLSWPSHSTGPINYFLMRGGFIVRTCIALHSHDRFVSIRCSSRSSSLVASRLKNKSQLLFVGGQTDRHTRGTYIDKYNYNRVIWI